MTRAHAGEAVRQHPGTGGNHALATKLLGPDQVATGQSGMTRLVLLELFGMGEAAQALTRFEQLCADLA